MSSRMQVSVAIMEKTDSMSAVIERLAAGGMTVEQRLDNVRMVRGSVPDEKLLKLSNIEGVLSVTVHDDVHDDELKCGEK